jgi:adiponectin receptor
MIDLQYYRIAFFLSLAFSAVGPLAALAILHSRQEMFRFIGEFCTIGLL